MIVSWASGKHFPITLCEPWDQSISKFGILSKLSTTLSVSHLKKNQNSCNLCIFFSRFNISCLIVKLFSSYVCCRMLSRIQIGQVSPVWIDLNLASSKVQSLIKLQPNTIGLSCYNCWFFSFPRISSNECIIYSFYFYYRAIYVNFTRTSFIVALYPGSTAHFLIKY